MKRSIVLSIVLLTITAAAATAQTTTTTTPQTTTQTTVQPSVAKPSQPAFRFLHFGIMAGTDIYKLKGASFDNNFKFGYSGGFYAELTLRGRFGLQPELLVNETVARTSDQFNAILHGVSFQNITLNYVSLPILVTFHATDNLTILLGPQYGYMFYQTPGLTQYPAPKEAFNKNDFSVIFGGQLDLSRKLRFGARYVAQYTQLNHIDDNVDSWKTRGFQIYMAYRLK